MRARLSVLSAVALASVVLAGCGSTTNTASSTGSTAATMQPSFTLSEWKIIPDGTITTGSVAVKIDNKGTETHELVIVKADFNSLPKKSDGSVDEDKIPEADKLGESGDVPAGGSVTKTFAFTAGNYVAFCNIVDAMGGPGSTMMGAPGTTMMGGPGTTMMKAPGTTMMGTPASTMKFAPDTTMMKGPGTTMMGSPGTTMMGTGGTTPMGGSTGTTPMGTAAGHIHFPLGMYVTFTVK